MDLQLIGPVAFDAIETPFGSTDKIIGGAGTYLAYAASYFAPKSGLVSVIGEDFPASAIEDIESRNVSTEGIQVKKGEKTFFWKGRYHRDLNSRDTLVTELNVLENFDPIIPESYQSSKFLMLGNLPPNVQRTVIERQNERPKLIGMDTMNFWMDNMMDELLKTIKLVDILIINDEEARQLSEEYSLRKAARKILDMGPKYLIIKKGEHGALLFDEDKRVYFAPGLPLDEVFDPTGAGDTFAGGFMGFIAKSGEVNFENMKRAVIYGSAMASFCVEKFGSARLQELTHADIGKRVKQFVDLIEVDIDLAEAENI